MKMLGVVCFALIAAIGNAFFAAGQKSAHELQNPFVFVALSASLAVLITMLVVPFLGTATYGNVIKSHGGWIFLSGFGLFLTYLSFNLLYTRYGTSSYVLYAVLSIITTSLIVGVFFFKEQFNVYHWSAFFFSLITVIFFAIGNKVG